jgi:hypothetical protein
MRPYSGETYLRAEHLLKNGRYIAARVTISDIVEGCPIKRGDKDGITIGLAFEKSDKILGLNKTNVSLLCWDLGEGKPQDWVGKQISLVVRLVGNKKLTEPAIRIWPKVMPPNDRIRKFMGSEITEDWYPKESTDATTPQRPSN